jgi:hypothetical protein
MRVENREGKEMRRKRRFKVSLNLTRAFVAMASKYPWLKQKQHRSHGVCSGSHSQSELQHEKLINCEEGVFLFSSTASE